MNIIQKHLVTQLLKPTLINVKNQFFNNLCFKNSNDIVNKSIGFKRNSNIRKLGSEEYFRCLIYAELTKRLQLLQSKNKFGSIVIGVEGKNVGKGTYNKRPDIFIADSKNIEQYIIIIELKVTGNYWLIKSYQNELNRYKNYCKTNNTLLCLICYYESKPIDIISKLNKNKKLKNNINFDIIEGYAFPPSNEKKWLIDGVWY